MVVACGAGYGEARARVCRREAMGPGERGLGKECRAGRERRQGRREHNDAGPLGGGGEGTMAPGGGAAGITPGEGEGARPSRRQGGGTIAALTRDLRAWDWRGSRRGERAEPCTTDVYVYTTILKSSINIRRVLVELD
jgi:hypothetical protein